MGSYGLGPHTACIVVDKYFPSNYTLDKNQNGDYDNYDAKCLHKRISFFETLNIIIFHSFP
jgi:hypothetical protein